MQFITGTSLVTVPSNCIRKRNFYTMAPSYTRRAFLLASLGGLLAGSTKRQSTIMTLQGPMSPAQLGKALIHEHFLVDFVGADKISLDRWHPDEVAATVLPYLRSARRAGVKSIFECTPAFLGRDVRLLQLLAEQSGLQIITNTGYYGARENKYLPPWAFTETAAELAQRWIIEFKNGIDQTNVRP
ncbi:MAG: phosphotriesterase, partial [Adhaeribacter sp.]|nr:phosphotriesterase [Adhaeribacter sp.]